jgi:protocatechuate 3,4-dioxygenase beta subunit
MNSLSRLEPRHLGTDSRQLVQIALIGFLALQLGCSGASEPPVDQDLEYNQALNEAQLTRPSRLSSTERIAPAAEPGTALVLHGRAFAADGRTPLADAIMFAYHTDREGLYRPRGAPAHTWRLKGWAKTDAEGRFEFHTIRPAPYPGRAEAAHIHLTLFTVAGAGYHAGALLFDDDLLVTAADREASRLEGIFGWVRPVRHEGVVEHVDINTRIAPRQKF